MTLLEQAGTLVGDYAPDFELPGIDSQVHHLGRYLDRFQAVGVILMCNRCSYVQSYLERLRVIQAEFEPQGLTLIGINTDVARDNNSARMLADMKSFATRHHLNFPYLWDSTQDVTRSFGADKTPTAFLIDRHGIVRYRGQIDDSPTDATAVTAAYLRNAIATLLKGKAINLIETETVGTSVTWRE